MMKNSLLLVILLYICASCGDFLEPKSQSEYIPKDAGALNEMLIGNAYPRPISTAFNPGLCLLDDDVACNPNIETFGSDAPKIEGFRQLYSWQFDMFEKLKDAGTGWSWLPINGNIWAHYYELILGTNAALDYIDEVEGSVQEKNVVKAQAYALRGLLYFYLVNIFGEPYNYNKQALGVPLKLNSGVETTFLPRNTVGEVYKQVLSDLDEAEKCYLALPISMQFTKGFRTNLPMVQLLKSRVYLYMENWKQAVIYANHVIKDWEFSLTDLNSLPKTGSYYQFISMDCSECIWTFGTTLDFSNYLTGTLKTPDAKYQPFFLASSDLINGYKQGDLRKKEYIVESSGLRLPYGKIISSTTIAASAFGQGLRLPEAYLNLAEAAAMDKDETTALWALNVLREKRFDVVNYKKITGITGTDLVDSIRQERRLELCFEFHRWFDLRRYGMPSISKEWNASGKVSHKYVLEEKDKGYTLPIPQAVLDENKLLLQNELAPRRNPKN